MTCGDTKGRASGRVKCRPEGRQMRRKKAWQVIENCTRRTKMGIRLIRAKIADSLQKQRVSELASHRVTESAGQRLDVGQPTLATETKTWQGWGTRRGLYLPTLAAKTKARRGWGTRSFIPRGSVKPVDDCSLFPVPCFIHIAAPRSGPLPLLSTPGRCRRRARSSTKLQTRFRPT